MTPPQKLRARVEQWCAERTPEEHKHEMRLEAAFRGNTAVVKDVRPPWDGSDGPWVDLPVARLRFDPVTMRWDLSWMRGTGRWERYPDWKPSTLDRCLEEIDADPFCVFWG